MNRLGRAIGVAIVLSLALVACGRTTSSGGVALINVYDGGVRLGDVSSMLDDSSNWWPGPPQFGTRPLDSSTRPEEERFDVTFRFLHNGSAETLNVTYRVWYSSGLASAIMSSTKQAVGSTLKGPSAGDEILYLNQKLPFGGAPYVSQALIRVGQIVVELSWSRAQAFASTNAEGNIAKKIVSKLNQYTSASAHPSPPIAPNPRLLPPDGQELTRLGTDTLPVEVIPQMVGAPAPGEIAKIFQNLGAKDFVFGDYALNSDTHMEVQTSAFTFSSPTGSTDWLDQFVGKANLDPTGSYFNFDDVTGQYIAAFGVGSTGIVMICRSAAELEAASRACESPMARVASAWKTELGG